MLVCMPALYIRILHNSLFTYKSDIWLHCPFHSLSAFDCWQAQNGDPTRAYRSSKTPDEEEENEDDETRFSPFPGSSL